MPKSEKSEKPKELIISGHSILPGESVELNLMVAKLPSRTPIDIPVFVNRAKEPGPTLLLLGGLHGDEINGVEIVRRIMEQKYHIPEKGTIITIPILNIYGFINFSREVPDGKDVNRSFPGFENGSLASRVAYNLTQEILPHIDVGIDYHTGGASRTNYPQIRCDLEDKQNKTLAHIFKAPFTIHSALIKGSLRHTATMMDKRILIFEGGESLRLDEYAIKEGIDGFRRILGSLEMGIPPFSVRSFEKTIEIHKRKWLRASEAGLFSSYYYSGDPIKKNQIIGSIADPFGDYEDIIKSPEDGFIIGLNNNPVVNQGDALMHIGFG